MHHEQSQLDVRSLIEKAEQTGRLLTRVYGDESPHFVDQRFFENVAISMIKHEVMQENSDGKVESTETALAVLKQARVVIPADYLHLAEKYVRR